MTGGDFSAGEPNDCPGNSCDCGEYTAGEFSAVTRVSAWAPGVETPDEWKEWAEGAREIIPCDRAPAIAFTDSLFRRRLSQISKMTIQVVHDLLAAEEVSPSQEFIEGAEETPSQEFNERAKIMFLSFRGELARQYQINKTLIEEHSLMPAAFSLSVFNTPPALAAIALGLKGGYSALYPGNGSFSAGLTAAEAALYSAAAGKIIFVYADEYAPPEYRSLLPAALNGAALEGAVCECAAFALLLERRGNDGKPFQSSGAERRAAPSARAVPLSLLKKENDTPEDFLKRLLRRGDINVSA